MDSELAKKRERKNNFLKLYRKELYPILVQAEVYRKKTLAKLIFCYFLQIFSLVPLLFCLFVAPFILPPTKLYYFVIGIFFSIPLVGLNEPLGKKIEKIKHNFKLYIKELCVPKILGLFDTIQRIEKRDFSSLNYDVIIESGLFKSFSITDRDDEFVCNYKSVLTWILECGCKYDATQEPQNNTRAVFMLFPLNKKCNAKTTVVSKKVIRKFMKISPLGILFFIYLLGIGLMFSLIVYRLYLEPTYIPGWCALLFMFLALYMFVTFFNKDFGIGTFFDLKKVNLEDIEFMKGYKVSSSDQIEARRFLTPAFIQRFKNIKSAFSPKDMRCAFYDDKLLIMVQTKEDLFEVGDIRYPVDNYNFVKRFYLEITSIFEMIDYLKLDD